MPPQGKPPRQFKRNYRGPRIGGRFGSLSRGVGRGLARGGHMFFKELTKKGPPKRKRGKISSGYFRKTDRMEIRRLERIIEGSKLPKEDKILAKLRLQSKIQHPEWSYQQNFSQKERVLAEKQIRDIYGPKVADDVKKKWDHLFKNKQSVTGKAALQSLGTMSNHRPAVRMGVPLIVKTYDQPTQEAKFGKYITEEKLGDFIAETEEQSGKYPGQVLRKDLMITEEEPGDAKGKKAPLREGRRGGSLFGSLARRTFGSMATPEAKRQMGSTLSPSRSSMATREAGSESLRRTSSVESNQPSIKNNKYNKNNMSKILLGVLVIVVVAGGAYFLLQQDSREPATQEQPSEGAAMEEEVGGAMMEEDTHGEGMMEGEAKEGEAMEAHKHVVVYTSDGYSPAELTIKKGDTVTFRNESSRETWPATDIHPTHTLYPNSSIEKCFDGSDTSGIFDACRGLAEGEEYSFVFTEVGEWRYHDHVRAAVRGTIIVEE